MDLRSKEIPSEKIPERSRPLSKRINLRFLQLVDDDGSVETALINYLFAKQVVNRLRSQMDVSDLQRKRSYWKQCAFNAVSCFGK
uniref:Prohormone-1 n=1 Tax=Timema cristinae TaxID=61476 RepID=A0A7R9D7Z3_TIMCR|nr:unnamed protein product [Timema cristinae]